MMSSGSSEPSGSLMSVSQRRDGGDEQSHYSTPSFTLAIQFFSLSCVFALFRVTQRPSNRAPCFSFYSIFCSSYNSFLRLLFHTRALLKSSFSFFFSYPFLLSSPLPPTSSLLLPFSWPDVNHSLCMTYIACATRGGCLIDVDVTEFPT